MTTSFLEKNKWATLRSRQNLWNASKKLAYPSVMWRLPRQSDKHFLSSFNEIPKKTKIDFEEIGSGFAFSPFVNPDGTETFFLKADLHYLFKETETDERLEEIISPTSINPQFLELMNDLGNHSISIPQENLKTTTHETQKEDFIRLVSNGINQIESGLFQKVVLSRTKHVILSSDFDVVSVFDKLCKTYPAAFVSVVSLPHLGVVWMGASPETLVSQDSKGIFRTMALAGTQSAFDCEGNLIKPSEALWRQKEIEEQSFVTRYIINCLKKIRVREFEEEGPKTIIAGNLMHLRTDIIINTMDINFPQLATVMLDLLHPTSAVCGMPKIPATDFILANEGYNREFYSGFLGPVNTPSADGLTESHIFVNLRTMKLQNNVATLYAGCGITADSDAEKEWQETEMKTQTLGKVLNNEV
ncbi:Isochorismate synthase MenF [Emticicia aquatica]|uniref:Isochorismate synthase MenF n=1 Tax=Emticicia aquatica TaxID=1681835 RepID=A0ABN8EWF1_9BACT|nr:chorismate-binding protein [Emticicia aquatica]CAH0997362.1 Isochorismate synthase MenF [Emticicia aquatica]